MGYNNGRIWLMPFQYYQECYSGRAGPTSNGMPFGSPFPSSLLKNPAAVQLQSIYCHYPTPAITVSSRVYFNISLVSSNGRNKCNSPVIRNMAGGLYIAPKGYPHLVNRGKSSFSEVLHNGPAGPRKVQGEQRFLWPFNVIQRELATNFNVAGGR